MPKISLQRTRCCGLRIVKGVGSMSPQKATQYICRRMLLGGYDAAFILFSCGPKSGDALKQFIINNNLGTLQEKPQGDMVIYIWEVHKINTRKWFKNAINN